VYEINPNPNDNTRIREVISFNNNQGCVTLSCSWLEKNKLVMSDSQGNLKLWDFNSNTQTGLNVKHNSPVKDVVFNSTVLNIASSGYDGIVNLYDPRTNQIANKITYPGKIYSMDTCM